MAVMDMAVRYGGFPGGNQANEIRSGGSIPPMRGVMPWSSGFEAYNRHSVLSERQKLLELIQKIQAEMAQRHAQVPIANYAKAR